MGRGVCTCNYGGEEGRQGQEEGCQEEDREEGKEEGCQEAHEEAAEGQEEADLEEGCRQPRLARKACQEQGWTREERVDEEQVDRRRDESPQGAQAQRLRRLQEGYRVLQGSPQELREVGRCRWRLPRITRCTTTCHF